MKKALSILITAFFLLSAAACSDNRERGNEPVGSGIYGDEAVDDFIPDNLSDGIITLDDLDGWWYLADGYPSEGVAMVQMFRLDAEAGTWITYDDWGEEYYVDQAYLTDDGKLCLGFELGDVYLFPEGSEILLDEDGETTAFVMGWPPEEKSSDGLDGNWYKNGDISAAYYLFEGSGCKKIPSYVEPSDIDSVQFLLREQEYYQQDGSLKSGTAIVLDDAYAIETFILSDDGAYFFILHDSTFYMREDVIGTPRGDEVIRNYRLMSISWGCQSDEGYERLEFYENDIFVLNRQVDMDVELKDSGTWSLNEDTLTLSFADGSSEQLVLPEDAQSLTVERYGFTFTENGY